MKNNIEVAWSAENKEEEILQRIIVINKNCYKRTVKNKQLIW